jgi:hypothetical protein
LQACQTTPASLSYGTSFGGNSRRTPSSAYRESAAPWPWFAHRAGQPTPWPPARAESQNKRASLMY